RVGASAVTVAVRAPPSRMPTSPTISLGAELGEDERALAALAGALDAHPAREDDLHRVGGIALAHERFAGGERTHLSPLDERAPRLVADGPEQRDAIELARH